jgi:hypothetical protein
MGKKLTQVQLCLSNEGAALPVVIDGVAVRDAANLEIVCYLTERPKVTP